MAAHGAETSDGWRWLVTANRTFDAVCDYLAEERSAPALLMLSFLAGAAYCLWLFDVGFLLGRSPYWENPRGLIGNSWGDMPTALSGYLFF